MSGEGVQAIYPAHRLWYIVLYAPALIHHAYQVTAVVLSFPRPCLSCVFFVAHHPIRQPDQDLYQEYLYKYVRYIILKQSCHLSRFLRDSPHSNVTSERAFSLVRGKNRTFSRSNMYKDIGKSCGSLSKKIPCYERGKLMFLATLVKCKSATVTALSK